LFEIPAAPRKKTGTKKKIKKEKKVLTLIINIMT
jgi:hypothetical protein